MAATALPESFWGLPVARQLDPMALICLIRLWSYQGEHNSFPHDAGAIAAILNEGARSVCVADLVGEGDLDHPDPGSIWHAIRPHTEKVQTQSDISLTSGETQTDISLTSGCTMCVVQTESVMTASEFRVFQRRSKGWEKRKAASKGPKKATTRKAIMSDPEVKKSAEKQPSLARARARLSSSSSSSSLTGKKEEGRKEEEKRGDRGEMGNAVAEVDPRVACLLATAETEKRDRPSWLEASDLGRLVELLDGPLLAQLAAKGPERRKVSDPVAARAEVVEWLAVLSCRVEPERMRTDPTGETFLELWAAWRRERFAVQFKGRPAKKHADPWRSQVASLRSLGGASPAAVLQTLASATENGWLGIKPSYIREPTAEGGNGRRPAYRRPDFACGAQGRTDPTDDTRSPINV